MAKFIMMIIAILAFNFVACGDTYYVESQGEKGDQGPTGPMGPEGPQGQPGEDGPVGAQGEKGDRGDPGKSGIDGEDGTDGAMGPQGEQGEKGEPGTNGTDGEDGENAMLPFELCFDDTDCWENERCNSQGLCIPIASPGLECAKDDDCYWNESCTSGACELLECDDGDDCTNESIEEHVCVHEVKNCDDGDACTYDQCSRGSCRNEFIPSDLCVCEVDSECQDSANLCLTVVCTLAHRCGVTDWVTPEDCDDDNPCTSDACFPETGECTHRPVEGAEGCAN